MNSFLEFFPPFLSLFTKINTKISFVQMKLVLEDHVKTYFLVRTESPVYLNQSSRPTYIRIAPTIGAIVIPLFISSSDIIT